MTYEEALIDELDKLAFFGFGKPKPPQQVQPEQNGGNKPLISPSMMRTGVNLSDDVAMMAVKAFSQHPVV